MEYNMNPNSIDGDDLLEVEKNTWIIAIHPSNNDFFFTEGDFIESINDVNDATRHCDKYLFTWNKIKDLEGIE